MEHASPHSNAYDQLVCGNLGLLFIELTLRCNERCLHCYADASPEQSTQLGYREIARALDEAAIMGERPRVQFTGGDPLIHPDLVACVRHARALSFGEIEIYTNGLLLHAAPLLEQLIPLQPSFAFSFYAHDATLHDEITRVPGSHERTVSAIRRVLRAQLPCRVSIIDMARNHEVITETANHLRDLGVEEDAIAIHAVRSIGRGSDGAEPRATGREPSPLPPRRGKLCIAANGAILPCVFSRTIELGNIRHGAIREQLSAIPVGNRIAVPEHWQRCQQRLSCGDCQLSAWLMEHLS